MEKLPTEIFQYGPTFALAVITIYLLIKRAPNQSTTTKQLEVISGNHLTHIQDAMAKSVEQHSAMLRQGDQSFSQHERMIELLARIEGKLDK